MSLRNIVVERNDRAGKIQWRIEYIGKVISERIILVSCGSIDSISIRQIRQVKLLLLS